MEKSNKTGKIGCITVALVIVTALFSGCTESKSGDLMQQAQSKQQADWASTVSQANAKASAYDAEHGSATSSSTDQIPTVTLNNGTGNQTINCKVGEVVRCKFNYTNIGKEQFKGLRLVTNGLHKNFTITNIADGGQIDDGVLTYSIVWGPVKFMNPGDSRDISFAVSPTKAGNFEVLLSLMTNVGKDDKSIMDSTGKKQAQVIFDFNVTA